MTSLSILAYAGLRMAAALVIALINVRHGARAVPVLLQAGSDAALAIGVGAYADQRLAERVGAWLELLVTYAVVWEAYMFATTARAHDHVPGDPVSAGAVGAQVFWVWEVCAVLPAMIMATIAAEHAAATGLYGYTADAVALAAIGTAVLLWERRRRVTGGAGSPGLTVLALLLWVAAIWLVN